MAKKRKNMSKKLNTRIPKKVKKSTTTSPKVSISDCVLKFVGATEGTGSRAEYEALFGVGRPVDLPLASYTDLLKAGAKTALAGLRSSMVKEGADLKFQVSRIAVLPFSNPNFSVPDARKVPAKYGKAGYDGVGAVRYCPVPHPDTGEAMIAEDTVLLYSGNPPPSRPVRRRRKAAIGDGFDHASTITFTLNDLATVKKALASIFYPPLARLPIGDPFEDEDLRFARGSERAERALMTLMCRSQLPVNKMLFGFGAGKSVMAGAIERIKYLMDQKCKGTPAIIHQDLVPHFWFDELRRLKLDHLSVPTIRLR